MAIRGNFRLSLASRNSSYDNERLFAGGDGVGERGRDLVHRPDSS